jgi:hypothetical protein
MGTPEVSTRTHRAGAHVQAEADRRWRWLLYLGVGAVVVIGVAWIALGGHGPLLIGIGLATVLALIVGMKTIEPRAERWERGAAGERKVGATLESFGPDWHVLHDIYLGRGNIDHIVVGPGGVYTVETKSHRGRISVDHVYDKMLGQAYAEKKLLEQVSGLKVEAMLVFSDAYLVGSVPAHRRGVTVLPERMLAGYFGRRRPKLTPEEAAEIAARLRLALEVDAVA